MWLLNVIVKLLVVNPSYIPPPPPQSIIMGLATKSRAIVKYIIVLHIHQSEVQPV